RQWSDALAAAGFTDDSERLARVYGEGHAVYRAHDAVSRKKVRSQVVYFEQRRNRGAHHILRASRGSSASRMPSPSRFTESTVSDRQIPGKRMIYPAI